MRVGNNELSRTTWQDSKDGGFVTGGYKNAAAETYSVDSDKLTLVYNESEEKGEAYTYTYELTDTSLTLVWVNEYYGKEFIINNRG